MNSRQSPRRQNQTNRQRSRSPGRNVRRNNPWIEFEKKHKGEFTRKELSREYEKSKRNLRHSRKSPGRNQRHENPWIEFQKEHRGEFSREELAQAYQEFKEEGFTPSY